MKMTPGQKIKIGAFTFTGLLVLVLAIFLIGNKQNIFNSTFNVYGVFKNVNGLQVGNNVRFAGINIGVVQSVNIVSDSSARVDLAINKKVGKFIKKDSKLSIGSDGLMGDKLVIISPGIDGTREVRNGDRLPVLNPVDLDKVIGQITGVIGNAATLTDGLTQVINKINSGKGTLGTLLNSNKLSKEMEGTVKQAKSTIKDVHRTSATLDTDLKAAQSNFLLRGFFRKKQKAKQDSIKKARAAAAKH